MPPSTARRSLFSHIGFQSSTHLSRASFSYLEVENTRCGVSAMHHTRKFVFAFLRLSNDLDKVDDAARVC
jgi:hypothetical protein